MAFPSNPTNGDTHTIGSVTWTWNGYAWDKQAASGGVSSFAGFVGAVAEGVTTNHIIFHNGVGITGSEDFTFDGTDVVLGGQGHFEGCFDGPIQKDIKADEALAAGDPVYITGNVGVSNRVTVAKSDASDPAKMPAAGIVGTAFSTNDEGLMTLVGSIKNFDTSGYTSNDELYVSPGGGLTLERPSSGSDLVQKIARVGFVNALTGTLMVHGAGRANDTPNLIHARAGISMDAGGITFPDGTFQSTAAYNAGYTAGNTAPAQADVGTGDFWFENDTGLYYANVYDGTTLGWLQISGQDGPTGPTGSDGAAGAAGPTGPTGSFDTSQPLTLTGGDTSTASLTIESDDNGTSAAPIIDLIRDPADDGNGANGDYLGQIKFKGQSDSGTERVYAKITGKIGSATNTDEDGVVEHMVQADGSSDIIFRVNKNGIAFTDGKALIFEGDTSNTSETTLYVVDPSADRTINLPDESGTVVVKDGNGMITVAGISSDAGITVDGPSNFLDSDVSRPNLKDYSEDVNAIGTVTTNTAVNFENGNVQTVTVGGNCEFSFSNPPASGKAGTITLLITNGGAHTTTFASAVKFPGGVAPSLTTSGIDIVSFVTTDGGTNIYGFIGGINFS